MPLPTTETKFVRFAGLSGHIVIVSSVLLAMCLASLPIFAQSAVQGVDLSSPEMTEAELTREQVVEQLSAAFRQNPADFTGKRLSGLDLSRIDFKGAILRSARLNNTNLSNANLADAILDQAWMLNANLSGAQMQRVNLFQTQMIGAVLDGADLSDARITADLTKASLKNAKLVGADLSADMRNQSMGMMRGILRSANLDGADLTSANLSRADFEFSSLKGANLENANLMRAKLGGADLTGARISHANFNLADVASATLVSLEGEASSNLSEARNLALAIRR